MSRKVAAGRRAELEGNARAAAEEATHGSGVRRACPGRCRRSMAHRARSSWYRLRPNPRNPSSSRTDRDSNGFIEARYSGFYEKSGEYYTPEARGAVSADDWNTIDAAGEKPEIDVFSSPVTTGAGEVTVNYRAKYKDQGWVNGTVHFSVDASGTTVVATDTVTVRVKVEQTSNGQTDIEVVCLQKAPDGSYTCRKRVRGQVPPVRCRFRAWDAEAGEHAVAGCRTAHYGPPARSPEAPTAMSGPRRVSVIGESVGPRVWVS